MKSPLQLVYSVASHQEVAAAHDLIHRTHYQSGTARGQIIIARFADSKLAQRLLDKSGGTKSLDPLMAGVAVIGSGCVRGKPVGRRHLAKVHFPTFDLDRMARNVTVNRMGLAMIHRVAVEPAFQGNGIGTALALQCLRCAKTLIPSSRFVEVITTHSVDEANALLAGEGHGDFLRHAGFILAPGYTGQQWRRLKGPESRQEKTVRLYYWAPVAT